jgi:imidazolonepropionase-like amidohydrolase
VLVRHGVIAEISAEPIDTPEHGTIEGGVLFPGFVDAHVHLALSTPLEVARGGVTTVLDLGAPLPFALTSHPPLRFRFAGPLITATKGYPTQSWGWNGYGLEVATPIEGAEAVIKLAAAGASIIKVALEPREGAVPDDGVVHAIVDTAHMRHLLVAAHAMDARSVDTAVECGVDVLAHTPSGRIRDEAMAASGARGMWVISTLAAFGRSRRTRRNLQALHAAGCRIAYGTDLGNGAIRPGLDVTELADLEGVTGDVESALRAACADAGALAGSGGRIAIDADADLVWVPVFDGWGDLKADKHVWIGGERVT